LNSHGHIADSDDLDGRSRPLVEVLSEVARNPQHLLRLWNWKSAALSIILRGPIFLVAASRQGWAGVAAALLTECAFCGISAGFYGTVVQFFKDAEPRWLTGVLLAVVIPGLFQAVEYAMHWLRGTPHLRIAELVSLTISGVSALFNWYTMRRGTLLVGRDGASFGKDLRRLPMLLVGFLRVLPAKLASNVKRRSVRALTGMWAVLFSGR